MKQLKLIKEKELGVTLDESVYCDFCGEKNIEVFTSSFDDSIDSRKCVMQICFDCVRQLDIIRNKLK